MEQRPGADRLLPGRIARLSMALRQARDRSGWSWAVRRGGAALLAALLALPLLAPAASAAAQDYSNVTVSKIAADPNTYVGRVVSVTGEVEQAFGSRSFTIE